LIPEFFPRIILCLGKSRVLVGPNISFSRWGGISSLQIGGRHDEEELESMLGWKSKAFLVEENLEEWRCKKSLFFILTFSSSLIVVSKGKLKSEDEALKWFFKFDSESEGGKMKGGLFLIDE